MGILTTPWNWFLRKTGLAPDPGREVPGESAHLKQWLQGIARQHGFPRRLLLALDLPPHKLRLFVFKQAWASGWCTFAYVNYVNQCRQGLRVELGVSHRVMRRRDTASAIVVGIHELQHLLDILDLGLVVSCRYPRCVNGVLARKLGLAQPEPQYWDEYDMPLSLRRYFEKRAIETAASSPAVENAMRREGRRWLLRRSRVYQIVVPHFQLSMPVVVAILAVPAAWLGLWVSGCQTPPVVWVTNRLGWAVFWVWTQAASMFSRAKTWIGSLFASVLRPTSQTVSLARVPGEMEAAAVAIARNGAECSDT